MPVSSPKNPLVAWLLAAALAFVAVAPPGGLGLCISEDGHLHIGAAGTEDGCACSEEQCACPQDGHRDLAFEAVQLLQRDGGDALDLELPGAELAPVVLLAAIDAREQVQWVDALDVHPAWLDPPPQWSSALRTIVLRS